MKKKIILLFILALLPISCLAKTYYEDYNTKNFKDTLIAEEMEIENKDYKENDKQAIIYLFRGQGCGFCRSFLTFLNSISKEYGNYFKVVSFEVWYDSQNNSLFNKVAALNGEDLSRLGVPYYIIGDKKFSGYREDYNEDIKKAIMNQYNHPGEDIFDKLSESEKPETTVSNIAVIFWTFLFVAVGTFTSCMVSTKNTEKVMNRLNELKKDNEKGIVKKEIKKDIKEKKTKEE